MKLRIAVADDSESDMKRLISAIESAADGVCGIECSCFSREALIKSVRQI